MNEKLNNKTLLQLALIIGVIVLASMQLEGWGWLIFVLLCTF